MGLCGGHWEFFITQGHLICSPWEQWTSWATHKQDRELVGWVMSKLLPHLTCWLTDHWVADLTNLPLTSSALTGGPSFPFHTNVSMTTDVCRKRNSSQDCWNFFFYLTASPTSPGSDFKGHMRLNSSALPIQATYRYSHQAGPEPAFLLFLQLTLIPEVSGQPAVCLLSS